MVEYKKKKIQLHNGGTRYYYYKIQGGKKKQVSKEEYTSNKKGGRYFSFDLEYQKKILDDIKHFLEEREKNLKAKMVNNTESKNNKLSSNIEKKILEDIKNYVEQKIPNKNNRLSSTIQQKVLDSIRDFVDQREKSINVENINYKISANIQRQNEVSEKYINILSKGTREIPLDNFTSMIMRDIDNIKYKNKESFYEIEPYLKNYLNARYINASKRNIDDISKVFEELIFKIIEKS